MGYRYGGRGKGTKNKVTDAQADLLKAWDRASGPETALKLMKAAVEEALGKEIITTDADGKETKRMVRNFEPLRGLLPYIARKMPETIKFSDPLEDASDDQIKALAKRISENMGG